jgi:FAD/FMN-containing dehydrogenase
VSSREPRPAGFVNRRIERKVSDIGGIKSLYSDSYFTEDEFWSIYNRRAYAALKARYDPAGALGDLYAKCVLRQ